MKGFKDSNKKFHPIKHIKGVRSRRDRTLKPDGVRLARQEAPFMKKGKLDEMRLKDFWNDLTPKEKGIAVMFGSNSKKEWKDLTKKDKKELIEYEKRVTDPRPSVKNELIKRAIVPLHQVKNISEKEANEFLTNDNEINQIEEKIKGMIDTDFNYEVILENLEQSDIEEDPDDKGMFVRGINIGSIENVADINMSEEDGELIQFKIDAFFDQFNDQLQRRFGIGNVYAFAEDDSVFIEQKLDPANAEENKILISKGILRSKRDF